MSQEFDEIPFVFSCRESNLVGILHQPQLPRTRGLLIVVGGPQTRVGSHRQFVLLARHLAADGIPVMRFDYRGMGDSDGEFLGFEGIGPDIAAAIEEFTSRSGVREIVLWGLCDAASAICFHAYKHPSVTGVVMLNPWVRNSESLARARVSSYYLQRAMSRDFWKRLVSGQVACIIAVRDFCVSLIKASGLRKDSLSQNSSSSGVPPQPLADRMLKGLQKFQGRILLVLSGEDLTAEEFRQTALQSKQWLRFQSSNAFSQLNLPKADHTFSQRESRDRVAERTREWVKDL